MRTLLGTAALLIAASTTTPAFAAVRMVNPHTAFPSQQSATQRFANPNALQKLLYVGDNANNQISVFSLKGKHPSTKPIYVISSGLFGPQGLTTDRHGNLWVTNLYGNTVLEYAPGALTPSFGLTNNINSPTDVKVDAAGNVYVANSPGLGSQSYILKFPAGSTTPSSVWFTPYGNEIISSLALLNPTNPAATSIYAAAYIVNPSTLLATGYILSCYPGSSNQCVQINPTTFGQTGGILVEQSPGGAKPFQYSVVDQYVPGIDTFTNQQMSGQTVTGGTPQMIALTSSKKDMFVADQFYGRVTEYSWPSGTVLNQFYPATGNSRTIIIGVAVSPAGTYF